MCVGLDNKTKVGKRWNLRVKFQVVQNLQKKVGPGAQMNMVIGNNKERSG